MSTAIPLHPFCAFIGMLLGDIYLYIQTWSNWTAIECIGVVHEMDGHTA
jgi:hypothetical protein